MKSKEHKEVFARVFTHDRSRGSRHQHEEKEDEERRKEEKEQEEEREEATRLK